MAAKRIRSKIAKTDIDNAFIHWFNATSWGNLEASEADNRVKVWLKQVDDDAARLHKAMLACQALDTANNDADVRQATKLAREAIEG